MKAYEWNGTEGKDNLIRAVTAAYVNGLAEVMNQHPAYWHRIDVFDLTSLRLCYPKLLA